MKKVLSYILFGTEGRFWNNIPYILMANSAIYPDFHMKFYVQRECVEYCLYPLLSEPAREFDNIEIEVIDEPIQGTRHTIWRMKPLWENDVSHLFCRDLDYVVTETERKCVEFFIQKSDKIMHCMRCYHLHSIPLMAGLCGFKVPELFEKIKNRASTFEEYLRFGELNVDSCREWIWGCDQSLLRDFFTPLVNKYHLDCPVQTANTLGAWSCKEAPKSVYENIELPAHDKELMDLSTSMLEHLFIGQPYIIPGYLTKKWLDLGSSRGLRMADILKKTFADHPEIQLGLDEREE